MEAGSSARLMTELVGDSHEFFQAWWQNAPLLRRDAVNETSQIRVSLEEVARAIWNPMLRPPYILMMKDGAPVPKERYSRSTEISGAIIDDHFDVTRALQEFESGATIVLRGVEQQIPSASELCRALATEFGSTAIGHLFLTPKDAQGYGWHRDGDDNFVVQLLGAKTFETAPGRIRDSDRGRLLDTEKSLGESDIERFDLTPGDVLYLPPGCPHRAMSDVSGPSMHLSLWVKRKEWLRAVAPAMQEAVRASVKFVPLGASTDDARAWVETLTGGLLSAIGSVDLSSTAPRALASESAVSDFLFQRFSPS